MLQQYPLTPIISDPPLSDDPPVSMWLNSQQFSSRLMLHLVSPRPCVNRYSLTDSSSRPCGFAGLALNLVLLVVPLRLAADSTRYTSWICMWYSEGNRWQRYKVYRMEGWEWWRREVEVIQRGCLGVGVRKFEYQMEKEHKKLSFLFTFLSVKMISNFLLFL